jgi:hypothetical protein
MHFHGEVLRSDQHIDHINGDKSDNRIENLRVVTFQENMQNIRSARSHGKSGLLGVGWHNLEAELAALLKAIHELQLLIELEYPNQSL